MNHIVSDAENARSYLEKILAILDIEAQVHQEDVDESTTCYRIECKTDDARILIGRNGQTLESLQFIVRQMCRSGLAEHVPFIIDVLDYRSRRKRTIEDQAKRAAVAVLNGETERYTLTPMTPFERRIVHQYLQENFAELASESEGLGPDRHVVISFRGLPGENAPITQEEGAQESDGQESASHELS